MNAILHFQLTESPKSLTPSEDICIFPSTLLRKGKLNLETDHGKNIAS